jgi:hypothetical protein
MVKFKIVLDKTLVEDKCITMNVDLYNMHTKACTKVLMEALLKLGPVKFNEFLLQSLLAECKDHEVIYGDYKFVMINNEYNIFICKTCEEIILRHVRFDLKK